LPPFSPDLLASLPGPVQIINNLVGNGPAQLAALNAAAPAVFNTVQGGIRLPPQQQPAGPTGPQQGQQQQLPTGFDRRVIDIPPPTETRFVKDEVVLQIAGNVTVEQLQAAVGRLGLTLLASENLGITGSTVARFHISNGRSPAEIIRALTAIELVAVAQPNYLYTLQQQPSDPAPASRGDVTQGDPAQYMLQKLQIFDIHHLVRGANVPIAVIDSEIDVSHPDLEDAVTKRFDAVGAPEKPHAHGTGVAGAIAAHQRLLGTAPAARLLAVHAFSTTAATAESTTFNVLKSINWSVQEGARIINMSFAGSRDPSLERALKAAYDKGIVLVAAAGNAGPKSPPLFPGAFPFVIAVTATDVDDKLFTAANRGKYISVAAPGVDILVPAPEGEYQMTTGTSVAAAEVSGIVALLLERNPKLTPADIRSILTASAKRLAPGERDNNFGSGLIDPLQALQLADPRTATTTPPRRR
jgi:subtilisin family serine protease